jgi:ABC-2 type transport system ATP-binding protein
MIRTEDLTKRFGRVQAVNGVSFSVAEGEVLGLLGPNGAGKSTTMRMIMGLITPTSGRVLVAGQDVAANSIAARRRIGHLPEGNPLYGDMRVAAFLHFVAAAKGVPSAKRASAVNTALAECSLEEMRGRLIRHLSKGFRQRVGLAQAILGDPPVLILDEPTVGLDPRQIVEIRRLIRGWAGKRTVLLSTHILPEVEITCDRVIIINEGQMRAEGTPVRLSTEEAAAVLNLTVAAKPEAVKSAMRGLAPVHSVECDSTREPNVSRVRLAGDDLSALRRAATECAVKQGWEILAMSSGGGLEHAFLRAIGDEERP